jgi:hypothetical protein
VSGPVDAGAAAAAAAAPGSRSLQFRPLSVVDLSDVAVPGSLTVARVLAVPPSARRRRAGPLCLMVQYESVSVSVTAIERRRRTACLLYQPASRSLRDEPPSHAEVVVRDRVLLLTSHNWTVSLIVVEVDSGAQRANVPLAVDFEEGEGWDLCVIDDVALVRVPSGKRRAVQLPPEVFE